MPEHFLAGRIHLALQHGQHVEAVEGYANEEAFATYGEALSMVRTISDEGQSQETRKLLLNAALGRAELGLLLGEYDAAQQAIQVVEDLAAVADVGEALPRALSLRGDVWMALGNHEQADSALEAAVEAAEKCDDEGIIASA
ncbi:MAG: hypothetical protein VB997_02430, partial [Opitutales bacterium]